jgi:hypothetical protein
VNARWGIRLGAFVLLAAASDGAVSAERTFERATMARLFALRAGVTSKIDAFPVSPTRSASIRFERVQVYARDAQIFVMTAAGKKALPRSDRAFLRGYSADGSDRVALAFNADGTFAQGNGSSPEGAFVLRASPDSAAAIRLEATPLESAWPKGFKFDMRCANDSANLEVHSFNDLSAQLKALSASGAAATVAATSSALRLATVAIDTDTLFMSRLFANDTTTATNYIASMFNIMNLMYERDLLVELLVGTTVLRTNAGSDPYIAFTPGASTLELNFFANYWKVNQAATNRSFVVLLSGQLPGDEFGCSSSGLAWVNQYCQKGFVDGNSNTVGSYSIDQVCTSITLDPDGALNARLVGHELGHNFGARHTHCTDATTGNAPVSTNTIDTCFNLESSCYAGTPTCPAAGAGTIMSYCNFTTVSGCADNTQALLEFHPTQSAKLDTLISAQSSCLNVTDDIFFGNFE